MQIVDTSDAGTPASKESLKNHPLSRRVQAYMTGTTPIMLLPFNTNASPVTKDPAGLLGLSFQNRSVPRLFVKNPLQFGEKSGIQRTEFRDHLF